MGPYDGTVTVRPAVPGDVDMLAIIYDAARHYMRENGNMSQWTGGYPSREVTLGDIDARRLFCTVTPEDDILGVFCFFVGYEPTYNRIYNGEWSADVPYGVIHRIAVAPGAHGRGIAALCFEYAKEHAPDGYVRIDTHADNRPMQSALAKNGFTYRGMIYLADKSPRLAYDFLQP